MTSWQAFIKMVTDFNLWEQLVVGFLIIMFGFAIGIMMLLLAELLVSLPKQIRHVRILRNKRRDRF